MFARWCLGHRLPEGGEERIFMGRLIGGIERDPRAQPEVVLVLPQGHATEAPQDQVVVSFVPGGPEGQFLEQTTVHPKDVVRPEP